MRLPLSEVKPMLDRSQQCSTSLVNNHEPCLLANRAFNIKGFVCKCFLPSPPPPALSYFGSHPKTPKTPFFGVSLLSNPMEMLAM